MYSMSSGSKKMKKEHTVYWPRVLQHYNYICTFCMCKDAILHAIYVQWETCQ